MGGRLAGIARHDRPKGPMETLESVAVTAAEGVHGDYRGAHAAIEITDECEPCERMEALHPGLRAAMTPDWRGGFLGRVVEDGEIAVGDEVRVL